MTESTYKALKEAIDNKNKKSFAQIAREVGIGQKTVYKTRRYIAASKDYQDYMRNIKRKSWVIDDSVIKEYLINNMGKKSIKEMAIEQKVHYTTINKYIKKLGLVPPKKEKPIVQKKSKQQQKRIREHTNTVNRESFKKKVPKKSLESKKSGRTTRAIQAIRDEAQRVKALKEFTENLGKRLTAKDENELSVFIQVQVGRCFYTIKRADYDTPEKIESFKEKKRNQIEQPTKKAKKKNI